MRDYLSCSETAKLIRQALKESFPGIKFSVKSSVYSGGASITIKYFNGPTSDQVKTVTKMFEGAYFDGMTDYKGSCYGSLDGKEVRFGADYVFVNREFTKAFLEGAVESVCKYYGYKVPQVIEGVGYAYVDNSLSWDEQRRLMDKIGAISLCETKSSPTLARVGFLGDDGYGYGAVGRLAA